MVDPVGIKGGYRLDLGEVKLNSLGKIDLEKSVSSREVEAIVRQAKNDIGEVEFDRKKSNFEFRLKEKDGRAFLEFKERSAGGHFKASFGIGKGDRQRERDNAMQAIGKAFNLNLKTLPGVKQSLGANTTNFEAAKRFQSTVLSELGTNRALIAKLTSNPVLSTGDGGYPSASLHGIVSKAVGELIANPFEEREPDFINFANRRLDHADEFVPVIRQALEVYDAELAQSADGLIGTDDGPLPMGEAEALAVAVGVVKQKMSDDYQALTGDILNGLTSPDFDGLSFLEALDRMGQEINFPSGEDQMAHAVRVAEEKFQPILQSKSDAELAVLFESSMTNFSFMSTTLAQSGWSGRMIAEREGLPDPTNQEERAAQLQAGRNASRLGDISTTILFELIKEMKSRGQLEQPDATKDQYIFNGRNIDFNTVEMQNPRGNSNVEFIENFGKQTILNGGNTTQVLADIRRERN